MPPKISVLIPSYNHERYIAQTIESVLAQTCRDFELIVVDDGSTDNSWSVIQQLAGRDRRIQAYRQDNLGLIHTLNRLAKKASGDFIAQIDSDDMWFPKRLAWGLEDMEGDSSLSASFCSFVRIDHNNNLTGASSQLRMREVYGRDLMVNEAIQNWLCACTGFMRKSAIEVSGAFARNFSLAQDWDRWLRLSLVGNLRYRDDVGALYRVHDGNQSHDTTGCYRQCLDIAADLTLRVIDHYNLGDDTISRFLTNRAHIALHIGEYAVAARALRDKGNRFGLDEIEMIQLLQCLTLTKDIPLARELSRAMSSKSHTFQPETRNRLRVVHKALAEISRA